MYWHNGSPLTIGDFVMSMILTFDIGKADSAIFDEAQQSSIEAFLGHFKGVKIESIDPLVITTYEDRFYMNTENMVSTWYPIWSYGQAGWDAFGLMALAEADGVAAFSQDKATAAEIEWINLMSGPSLEILKGYLDTAQAENYIPYAPTMSQYVTAEEATLRYTNLQSWYADKGHFVIALGPLYLDQVNVTEQSLVLKRFESFPDKADKWAGFGKAKLAEATVEGPISVKKGDAAEFDVLVTFEGMPYPLDELKAVTYVLFDGSGNVVGEGAAEAVEDGLYKLTVPADQSGALAAGAAKLSVGVASKVVAIPTFVEFEFAVTE
jgi:peptide/nickel transport system substrate-binding protein